MSSLSNPGQPLVILCPLGGLVKQCKAGVGIHVHDHSTQVAEARGSQRVQATE